MSLKRISKEDFPDLLELQRIMQKNTKIEIPEKETVNQFNQFEELIPTELLGIPEESKILKIKKISNRINYEKYLIREIEIAKGSKQIAIFDELEFFTDLEYTKYADYCLRFKIVLLKNLFTGTNQYKFDTYNKFFSSTLEKVVEQKIVVVAFPIDESMQISINHNFAFKIFQEIFE